MKKKEQLVHPKTNIVRSKLSMNADSDLPDLLYIRDMDHTLKLGVPHWEGHPIVDHHAEVNQQVEVGVYKLMKIVKVNTIVKVSIDIFDNP